MTPARPRTAWTRTIDFFHAHLGWNPGTDAAGGAVGRYLLLGLATGRHIEGLVDAYYGPRELAERAALGPPLDPHRLVEDGRALIAALDSGTPLEGDTIGTRVRTRSRERPAPAVGYEPRRWACSPRRAAWRGSPSGTRRKWSPVTGCAPGRSPKTNWRRPTAGSNKLFPVRARSGNG